MARLTRQELEDIVASQRPGFRIVELDDGEDGGVGHPPVDRAPLDDEVAPLETEAGVREAGAEGEPAAAAGAEPAGGEPGGGGPGGAEPGGAEDVDEESPDEILVLAPFERGADPLRHGPGPKTIVVSGKDRRIIAEQG